MPFKATNGGAAATSGAEGSTAKDPPSNADLMADLDDDDEEEEEEEEGKKARENKEQGKGAGAESDSDEWTLSDKIDWSAF